MSGYPERINPMTTPELTPTPTASDVELARILADGRPAIRCGCGFFAVSDDQETNLEALNDHECPLTFVESAPADDRWYHHVFSLWGLVFLFIIACVLVDIFGHELGK